MKYRVYLDNFAYMNIYEMHEIEASSMSDAIEKAEALKREAVSALPPKPEVTITRIESCS